MSIVDQITTFRMTVGKETEAVVVNIQITNASPLYAALLGRISDENVVARIWAHDATVWSRNQDEIVNRLSWLDLPESMQSRIPRITAFVDAVRHDEYTHAVVLGMGGSSLAPDVFARMFDAKRGFPQLRVLDSTHPEAVRQATAQLPLEHTLFIVTTKSGTTGETLALFRYFYRQLAALGRSVPVGNHFVAITDPNTPLVSLASSHGFRDIFLNDPNLGGRYSALSFFGLIPAALLGIDLEALLQNARDTAQLCSAEIPDTDNPAVQLGALLAASALSGHDKATLLLSEQISPLADWIEQLIAESTGKQGKGIVPVLETVQGDSFASSRDRAVFAIRVGEDPTQDSQVRRLAQIGLPIAQVCLDSIRDLPGQFFVWEFATAVACHILGVHPFNQPNVESAKQWARNAVEESRTTGHRLDSSSQPISLDVCSQFLADIAPGDYVAIHAYLPPSQPLTEALQSLQIALRASTSAAVTIGYGPRFLHSTGQLHKGDRGNGHFIQLVSSSLPDVAIPDSAGSDASSLTFGALITAQAVGDRQALTAAGRPVLTLSVGDDPEEQIRLMARALESSE